MLWNKFSLEDTLGALALLQGSLSGLDPEEAEHRYQKGTREHIKKQDGFLWKIIRRRAKSSFLYILAVAAVLSFFLGQFIEALLILLFIAVNITLETYQEYHSEKAAQMLKRYLVTHSRVRRKGQVISVESDKIVVGDIVILEVGDRLPADIRFFSVNGLEIDESIMTGESMSVAKTNALLQTPPVEMNEAKNIGFAGTVVTAGKGEGIVFAIGKESAFGDIATLSEETERVTPFEKEIAVFSKFILKLVLFTLALIFFVNILIRGGETNIVELLIFSLALAVSVIPEALPVIITVALSRGSLRLAQKKVVVKRLSAIEDLGSIEVLCTDKTGTLTENALSVANIKSDNSKECIEAAFTACLENPTDRASLHDAFDLALFRTLTLDEREEAGRLKRIDAMPFDPEQRKNSVLLEGASQYKIVVRGAPEAVIAQSNDMDLYTTKALMDWVAQAGKKGERVLAVAERTFSSRPTFHEYDQGQLRFLGLISFSDTLKKDVKETLKKAKRMNVQVKILTGDSPEVSGAVGYAVGLISDPTKVYTGKQLDEMSYEKKREAIFEGVVFARVSPRQKYEIIKVLQEKQEVGFLGEGINDAPALKLANVALVVQGASDIAREAADIVLLRKSLEAVIDGISEGRIIFGNILKYLKVTLTANFGNFYSVALASLLLPFLPLLPIQILLLNLLSDFPMLAIATDHIDDEELEKPKNYQVHSIVLLAILFGAVSSIFDFTLFSIFSKVSPETMQTAWFLLSVITEIVLIFSLRSRFSFFRAKRASLPLIVLSGIILVIVLALPFTALAPALHFVRPDGFLILVVAILSVTYFLATEAMKRFYYQHFNTLGFPIRKKRVV
ncbi:MAG: HAD-IC family P-type ATPase [Patescibacteria group bacterium]